MSKKSPLGISSVGSHFVPPFSHELIQGGTTQVYRIRDAHDDLVAHAFGQEEADGIVALMNQGAKVLSRLIELSPEEQKSIIEQLDKFLQTDLDSIGFSPNAKKLFP